MKRLTKLAISVAFIAVMTASFFVGHYVAEQENIDDRVQRCDALLSLAIKFSEDNDLSDPGTLETMSSLVYAAYEFSLPYAPNSAGQLHDLWNDLMYRGDDYIGREYALAARLNSIAEAIQAEKQ